MPQVIPIGYAKVIHSLLHASASRRWSVSYGVRPEVGADGTSMANALDAAFRGAWVTVADSNLAFVNTSVYYQSGTGLALFTSTTAPVNGGTEKNSAPSSNNVGITKRTSLVGRANRGRIYLPIGLTEESVDELGRIANDTIATYQGLANDWLTTMQGSVYLTGGMWLLHSATVPPPIEVTSLQVRTIVRTQRRRLAKPTS